jgi:mono/diheme cytochrome c family protein
VQARKAYERGEFLASTDERFRPVYLSSAPDGLLYVVDMYRGIIEHRISVTMYLRDQILSRKLDQGTGYGRIYRVVHETSRRDTTAHLRAASTAQLVTALSHPNGWWRDAAQRLLIERQAVAAAPALRVLAMESPDPLLRLRALWTLDGLDRVETPLVSQALSDRSRDVRAAAVRMAERWLGEQGHPIGRAVAGLMDDPDAAVRRQVAASIGALPPSERTAAQVALLDRHGDDPITLDAALSGAAGREEALLQGLLQAGDAASPQRTAAITMIAATIVRSGTRAVDAVLGPVAEEARPAWHRSALLAGAEVALLGATMPGTPAPRPAAPAAAPAPCPTCPGGRAGPGGAYAFTKAAAPAPARRTSGPELQLSSEPAALVALAAAGGDLGRRLDRVLGRVAWPGKRGTAAVAPLTALEQQRFDAGREIYRNVCQACHQPDGRGQERIAPGLVGSALALAPAEIPTRVLLHGKEGAIGLMPPIGAAFGDEQLASVLTYIRREWGQTATAVDPATITTVRSATRGRTRPWTDAELESLPGWTGRAQQ